MNTLERRKPKTPQKKDLSEVSGRDLFQTPNYATDLLIPFLEDLVPMSPYKKFRIWECAAGQGKIVKRLEYWGFDVYGSDLDGKEYPKHNFLTQSNGQFFDCIVTNTPFSLKKEFYLQCLGYQKPFALLVPADYSGWIIKAIQDGAEKIIPTRRIDYITPNTLKRIWYGETWETVFSELPKDEGWELKEEHMNLYIESNPISWQNALDLHEQYRFDSIYEADSYLLRKYSSSYYHSMWLTWGFNLGRTETFVELTNEMKDNI